MLPAWREIYRITGKKVFVVVSENYSETLDGVSYVDVFPFHGDWKSDVAKARVYAMSRWCSGRVIQWWNDTEPVPSEFRGSTVLSCRGRKCSINSAKWPTYGHSMYERAGFPKESDWMDLPMVFDCRNPIREEALLREIWPDAMRKKPLLLFNVTGVSSPYGFWPELYPVVYKFAKDFHIVDLGKIRAHRIFDLLGAYDAAAGLITCDSAILHLAKASHVPTIAMTVDGWTGSVVRRNTALTFSYKQTIQRLPSVRILLEKWKVERAQPVLVPQS